MTPGLDMPRAIGVSKVAATFVVAAIVTERATTRIAAIACVAVLIAASALATRAHVTN